LVTEPLEGAKKEVGTILAEARKWLKRHHHRVSSALSRGLVGAVSIEQPLVARCLSLLDINATLRPAAGIVGVVAHPLTGGLMEVRRSIGGAQQAEKRVHQIRIEQGRQVISSSNVSLEDRARVVAAFKRAQRPENEKTRRRTMEERIQSVINQGGAGTVTTAESQVGSEARDVEAGPSSAFAAQASSQEAKTTLDAQDAIVLPPEWGEAEEAAFEKRLEDAKAASIMQSHGNTTGEQSNPVDEEFERELRMATEISLAEQRGFEQGLLQATAKWREGEAPKNTI
jgi:sterol 3beta-glucosyltransferase